MSTRTGYSERAYVAYQLLLELNLFCPTSLQSAPLEQKLEELSNFYDSEAPRLGEAGAEGWANTTADAEPYEAAPVPADKSFASTSSSGFARWADAEEKECSRRPYTSRLMAENEAEAEDAAVDDVYRYVMFADISKLLFLISSDVAMRQQLVYSYLNFIGLPVYPPNLSSNEMSTASLLYEPVPNQSTFFGQPSTNAPAFEIIGGEPMEAVRRAGVSSPTEIYGRKWPASMDTLLSSASFEWFTIWDETSPEQQVDQSFIRRVI